EVEVLDDRDPRPDEKQHVSGERYPELWVRRPDDVPGHVVGADGAHSSIRQPARTTGADAGRVQVLGSVIPKGAVAGADQDDIPGAHLHPAHAGGLLELLSCDRVVGRQALVATDVEQNAATDQRFERVDAMDSKADRCLDSRADADYAVPAH